MEVSQYKVGDRWTYKTRHGEESSVLYIVKIERAENSNFIYHIYIDNLKMKNRFMENGFQSNLPHIPVSKKTLNDSVVALVRNDTLNLPDISEGYNAWKEADGGVFTITIGKIIEYIEDTLDNNK